MQRRSTRLIAIFSALLVVALGLPLAMSAFDNPEAAPPAEVRPPQIEPRDTPDPVTGLQVEVGVDIEDSEERAATEAQLTEKGYVVSTDANTRVSDHPPRHSNEYSVRMYREMYALVVHPHAPVVQLTTEEVSALFTEQQAALLDGAIVTGPTPLWAANSFPLPSRVLALPSYTEVIDHVAQDPTALGIVPIDALNPRVRALVVDEFDPYRDRPEHSPLADRRWVIGPQAEANEVFAALGWSSETPAAPVGLLATGELIPARCVSDRVAAVEGGYGAIFDGTRDLLRFADLAMSHWEPAVIEGVPTPCTPTFNLSTRPEAAQAAADAGVDVMLAAGNHMGDCWDGCGYQDAVLETLRHLEAAGLVTVGAGEDLEAAREPGIVEVDGVTFAFLAYDDIAYQHYGATEDSAGTAHADLEGVAADVRAAAERADHVIVGFSWGVEYVTEPTERQRDFAHAAVEAGASLVVGNHPHWVQATEWIGDAFVAYSLGNFIFDQDWSAETSQGAILEVGFTRDRILGVRLRPTAVRQQYQVELLDPTTGEGASILQRMWDASDALPPR